jgi:surface antigen
MNVTTLKCARRYSYKEIVRLEMEQILMKNVSLNIILLVLMSLVGCTSVPHHLTDETTQPTVIAGPSNAGTPEVQNTPDLPAVSDAGIGGTFIGGAVEQAMDETDKSKMLHAMDKAPGKVTHWTNTHTNIEYTVIPTKKVHVQDKNYCRQYQMTAMDSNEKEQAVQGIACIASDGNWHTVQG